MSTKLNRKKLGRKSTQDTPPPPPPVFEPIPANVVKTPHELLQLVCKLSLSSGIFVDTKFYAYSRRATFGAVYSPKAVYANSYILRTKAPEYFGPLLQGGYMSNCATGPLNGDFPAEFSSVGDDEGYDSDSDLEDDDEDGGLPDGHASKDMLGKDGPEGSNSSWDLTGDEKGKATETRDDGEGTEKDPPLPKDLDNAPTTSEGVVGKVRLMERFAYPTWNAFIFYLYTGQVNFALLKSQNPTQASSDAARRDATTPTPPQCSPKSMYRLADELGLNDLKNMAKSDIESKLSPKNILTELFSSFTMKYDEIRDMQINYACSQAKETVTSDIFARMESLSSDELSRSIGIIASLIQKFGNDSSSGSGVRYNGNQLFCRSCGIFRTFRCTACSSNWQQQ